jgi:hypothetical protein
MYRDPTPAELQSPLFEAIWQAIKSWDVNVPSEYEGYCGSSGNHVCVILDALKSIGVVDEQTNNTASHAMPVPCVHAFCDIQHDHYQCERNCYLYEAPAQQA